MILRTFLLPLLLLTWLYQTPTFLLADSGPEVAASYSMMVTEKELAGWLQHKQQTASIDRKREIEELILIKSLANEAAWLGLDRRLETRLDLELREASLAQEALRLETLASIHISEEEIEAKYQVYKDTFTQPRRVRLRNLFKRYPPGAEEAARAAARVEMEELRRRLVAGEDFAELATAHSDSQTRFQGGLLGNVPAGKLAPTFDAIAMAMQPGEISEILSGSDGFTLLFCEKILPKVVRSAEELRDIAHKRLRNQTKRKRWEARQAEWLEAAKARYDWQVVTSEVSSDAAVVVEFVGGELTRRQVVALMSSPRPISQLPQQQVRRRIEAYLISRVALREAERRGVETFDGLENRQLWARRKVLAEKASLRLVEEHFEELSEEEVRRYYDDHRESFIRPMHFDLAAILLPPLGEDVRQDFRQGELVVHRIETGELTFDAAARRHSLHPSAQDGGRLGWISRPALPRVYGLSILKVIFPLAVGEMSGLFQDGDKLWIFKLLALEEERPMTWEEARSKAENGLGNERVQELEARLREERLQTLRIEMTSQ